ncbi:MAG TPA: glycoside hydrolase family 9 protein [Micromonosporaceae bacterium]|jgi:endoglucanase|nr:glycoside hydrolase family 9 protein [Micromonosporaceae bacterium]
MRRRFATARTLVIAAMIALGIAAAPAGSAVASTSPVAALVRVDQVGYLPNDVKQAYLMTPQAVAGARFAVVNAAGHTVYSGSVSATNRGKWNAAYPDVYAMTFTAVRATGRYHIVVTGSATGTSPTFRVESAASMYGTIVANGVAFYQVQRDGSNVVPGALHRKPSHLNDANATVYADPNFLPDGDDVIADPTLTPIGGPVDVEGGWFDAGDYLKFTHTTAFGDAILYASERALGPAAPANLDAEARFGEQWLDKVWDQSTKTLYLQVGIGSGNDAGTFFGDHDLWRLPQADDSDTDPADVYAAAHRPVFEAAAPGHRISPNLVGRVSAAFALAAQVDAAAHPARAAAEFQAATSLYAMADTTSPPDPLVTALPNSYYPESTWHDDMEFGATEIALAALKLGHDAVPYVRDAARWAVDYLASDTGDTFNLYDTSALAHADLITAISATGHPSGLAVTRPQLVADLKRQLDTGADRAAGDVFHAGAIYDDFDADSHTFGFITTEALYRATTGDTSYQQFATQQRDWLFGANAWGASFMVGEGDADPSCMQHQVSNLGGASTVGAVVNGPNDKGQFAGGLGGRQDGMAKCPADGVDRYKPFTGHGSRYVDDVRSWQSSEPALDMSGAAILAAALSQATQ